MTASSISVLLLFCFGATIFYVLLAIERKIWFSMPTELDFRLVHQVLKGLIPVLPPSNGVVVIGGLACLVWQAIERSWDWRSVIVLGFDVVVQLLIIFRGKIAAAVRDVKLTASDGDFAKVKMGFWN